MGQKNKTQFILYLPNEHHHFRKQTEKYPEPRKGIEPCATGVWSASMGLAWVQYFFLITIFDDLFYKNILLLTDFQPNHHQSKAFGTWTFLYYQYIKYCEIFGNLKLVS